MQLEALADELRQLALDAGLAAVGFAPAEPFTATREVIAERKAAGLHGDMQFTYRRPERSTDPNAALAGARSLIVGARSYRRADVAPPRTGGPAARVARYAWRDHYRPLRHALGVVAARLEAEGYRARVLADDNALVDRAAAVRAGIGFYGKSTNVLLPGTGSWYVLGSVVTDAPLARTTPPPVPDGCGTCTRCLDHCPTGAIVAPGVVDARRCLAWLVQAPGVFPVAFRAALGDRIYGCDDCQEVCPPNRLHDRREPPLGAHPADDAWVTVLDVLSATDDEILRRFGRWYVPERSARYVRRNALVVLGNVGDGGAPEVVGALRRCLVDPDPIVRAHAVWAALHLDRADLVDELTAGDPDPLVRAERDRAIVSAP